MKIELDKKHTLYSDRMNIWITRKVARKKRGGTGTNEYEEVISGYHRDLDSLLDSLRMKKIRGVDTKVIEEFNDNIKTSSAEIVKFSREISKFVMECRKGE